MRKGKDLIGMPVVVANSGVEIERVEGLVLDLSETHISALLVDSDDWSRQARILPLLDVQSFGDTEIEVGSAGVIQAVDQIPDIRRILNLETKLSGAHLVTSDGTDVGTVDDLVFDEDTGDIDSFEVSNDTISDLYFKREPLPLFDELDDEIIVHTSKVRQLAGSQPLPRLKSRPETVESQGRQANGKINGDEFAKVTSKQSASHLAAIVPAGRQGSWSGARDLWGWLKSKTSDLLERVIHAAEKRRVKRALGHRIRCTVLARDNAVIFEKGDVITPAVVEHARQANVLQELLGAVDRSPVETTGTKEEGHSRGWLDDWWPPFI